MVNSLVTSERIASDRDLKVCGAHRSHSAERDAEGRVGREARPKKTEGASKDRRLKFGNIYVA